MNLNEFSEGTPKGLASTCVDVQLSLSVCLKMKLKSIPCEAPVM